LLLIFFIISQWVYQMIIQAHLGIMVASDIKLGWQKKHIRLLLILFIISQWVYQMIIQAHLGIIVALDVILGWRD
jgi:hypothetical protein